MNVAENLEVLPEPRSGNYEVARFNALRHGVLSRYTVLPWEDGAEYRALLEALVAEHHPQGPTEAHLVEELAGVIWRKRRLRLGESAEPVLDVPDAINNSAPAQSDPTRPLAARSPALGSPGRDQVSFLETLLSDVFVRPLLTGARHAALCIAVKRQEQSSRVIA